MSTVHLLYIQSCTSVVRITNGITPNEGRVEILYNGAWGTVCDSGWDLREASVVCRNLGYVAAEEALWNSQFGQGSGTFVLDGVSCGGRESDIFLCDYGPSWNHQRL